MNEFTPAMQIIDHARSVLQAMPAAGSTPLFNPKAATDTMVIIDPRQIVAVAAFNEATETLPDWTRKHVNLFRNDVNGWEVALENLRLYIEGIHS